MARNYTWFVEPLDSHTNKVFSDELLEEDFYRDLVCQSGIRRNLWRCSWKSVSEFWNSKNDLGLRFKVYSQEGQGQIRECTFLFRTFLFKYLRKKKVPAKN